MHGSVGIALLNSRASTISGVDVHDFWSAFYVNSANADCMGWRNPDNAAPPNAHPWTACGRMGGHLVERSRLHDNWWGFYSESGWDLGDIWRENLAWNNGNQVMLHPGDVRYSFGKNTSTDFTGQYGGFAFIKDVMHSGDVVSHNSFVGNIVPLGHNGFRATNHHLWADNVFHVPESLGQTPTAGYWTQLHRQSPGKHFHANAILHSGRASSTPITQAEFRDSTLIVPGKKLVSLETTWQDAGGQLVATVHYDTLPDNRPCWPTSCWLPLLEPVTGVLQWRIPWELGATPGVVYTARIQDPIDASTRSFRLYSPICLDSAGPVRPSVFEADLARQQDNRHCRSCRFESLDPANPGFLVPRWGEPGVDTTISARGWLGTPRGAIGRDGRVGSHLPVRVRAAGMPGWDWARGMLRLPIRFHSETLPIQRLVVIAGQVRARSLDETRGAETRDVALPFRAGQELLATSNILEIPVDPGKDSLIQIDLWFAGISGRDPLPATPMSWTWTSKTNLHAIDFPVTTHSAARATPVSARLVRRAAGPALLVQGAMAGASIAVVDVHGRQRMLPLRR